MRPKMEDIFMENKIKLLSVGKKKAKSENLKSWERTVEMYAPGMYELLYSAGEKDTLKQVKEFNPEIVLILPSILQGDLLDSVQLIKDIKQLSPKTTVFVNLGMVYDEQEAIDEFMSCGAYKCYVSPVVMDTLFHDMYVALNLE